jgi:hypothetical protein
MIATRRWVVYVMKDVHGSPGIQLFVSPSLILSVWSFCAGFCVADAAVDFG